jgi:hypothetical protein
METTMKQNRQAAVPFILVTVFLDMMGIAIVIPVLPGAEARRGTGAMGRWGDGGPVLSGEAEIQDSLGRSPRNLVIKYVISAESAREAVRAARFKISP